MIYVYPEVFIHTYGEDDDEYIGDPDDFIRGLMGEEIQGSTARGTRRKNRKTRRNKRKSSNRHRK